MANIELTAVYDRERFRFGNAEGDVLISGVVLEDESLSAAKGPDLAEGFQVGAAYRFFGQWTEYTNKRSGETEKQFAYRTCVKCAPLGRHGVIKYLQTAPGIGPAIAKRLWDAWGPDAVRNLREKHMGCLTIPGLTAAVGDKASDYLQREFAREACVIDLMNLLDGQGFPKTTTRKCIDKWGNRAANFIRKNPYLLMQFRGIGFKRCDQLYAHLGLPMAAMKRQALCMWYGVAQSHQNTGDTWVPKEESVRMLRANIAGCDVREKDALTLAIRGGILRATWTDGANGEIDWDGTSCWLADVRKARSESLLATLTVQAMRDQTPLHAINIDSSFSEHQAEKIDWLIKQPGCIKLLGGGPGSGKTWCVAKIAQQAIAKFGLDRIALAAPTGKAAVRITEAMQSHSIPLTARTWHSLLGVKSMSEGDGWGFDHGDDYPLPYRVIIGDESSMLDTTLAANIFTARQAGTLFLLCGDVHQLPPVGHGAPLRDMIAAGVPYAELTEIRRNSGEIVEQCRRIREEGQIEFSDDVELGNLKLIPSRHPAEQIRDMLKCVDAVGHQQMDPVWDCQVLTPTNKSGDLGRKNLNKILQAQLNPSPEIKGSVFRLGDKVVCLKNSWCTVIEAGDDVPKNENNQCYVANGDLGIVRECAEKWMAVELQSPFRMVRIGRGAAKEDDSHKNDGDTLAREDEDTGTGCSWDLAYCLSCHKSQGAEWPVVIVMLDGGAGARRLCDRSWIYTAISRAKKYCVCVGLAGTAMDMVRRAKMDSRKTFLREFIKDEIGQPGGDPGRSIEGPGGQSSAEETRCVEQGG